MEDLEGKSSRRRPNRYRFRTLTERAQATSVSVSRSLLSEHDFALTGDVDEDSLLKDTYLGRSLDTERQIDLSPSFQHFCTELEPLIQSLPLILHNLSKIVTLFSYHLLRVPDKSSLLRLTVQLAKDAQQELWSNGMLEKLLASAFGLISGEIDWSEKMDETVGESSVNREEYFFTMATEVFKNCGALLMELHKTIWQKDPELKMLRPFVASLLTHEKAFVRRFAGEMFAPLFRQLPSKLRQKQVRKVVCRLCASKNVTGRSAVERERVADGAAYMFFNMVRNVQAKLHSCAKECIDTLFETVKEKATKDERDADVILQRFRVIRRTLELVLEYISKDTAHMLWEIICPHVADLSAFEDRFLEPFARLLNTCLSFQGMSKLTKVAATELHQSLFVQQVLQTSFASSRRDSSLDEFWYQTSKAASFLWRYEFKGRRDTAQVAESCRLVFVKRLSLAKFSHALRFAYQTVDSLTELYGNLFVHVLEHLECSLCKPNLLSSKKSKTDKPKRKSMSKKSRKEGKEDEQVEELNATCDLSLCSNNEAATVETTLDSLAFLADMVFFIDPKFDATTMVSADKLPEESSTMAWCKHILTAHKTQEKACSDAIHALQLCQSGNSSFESSLVEFVISTSKQSHSHDMERSISFAIRVLCSNAKWTTSLGHQQLRQRLVHFFIDNLATFLQDPLTLFGFADVVDGTDLLSQDLKNRVSEDFSAPLIANLLSNSHQLRLASLKLLRHCSPPLREVKRPNDPPKEERPFSTVLDTLVELEALPVDFFQEKTRTRLVGNLEQQIRMERIPKPFLPIVARFLLGQFFVPYKPMWDATAKALEVFAKLHFNEHLWEPLWELIQHLSSLPFTSKSVTMDSIGDVHAKDNNNEDETGHQQSSSNNDEQELEDGDVQESVREDGRDDPLFEAKKEEEQDIQLKGQLEAAIFQTRERSTMLLDVFKQLFMACRPFAKRIESKSDLIVPLFFVFLRDEYYGSSGREDDLDEPGANQDENLFLQEHVGEHQNLVVSPQSTLRVSNEKLASWLTLFSGFTKFKPCDRTTVLRNVFERYLIKPDYNLQLLSLRCLKQMQLPFLLPHYTTLEDMADDKKFREAITTFSFSEVDPSLRKDLLPVIFRILFGRLATAKRKTSKESLSVQGRRASIFAFFSGVRDASEIRPLLDIIFRPFPAGVEFTLTQDNLMETIQSLQVQTIPHNRLIGFVVSLEELIKTLGSLLQPFLHQILATVFACLIYARQISTETNQHLERLQDIQDEQAVEEKATEDDKNEDEDEDQALKRKLKTEKSFASQLRLESIRRLSDIVQEFAECDLSMWASLLNECMSPLIATLPTSVINQNKPPALLHFALALSESADMTSWGFIEACPSLFPNMLECLGAGLDSDRGPGPAIVGIIYDILDRIMKNETAKATLVESNVTLLLDMLFARLTANAAGAGAGNRESKAQVRRAQAKRELRILHSVALLFVDIKSDKVDKQARDTCEKLVQLLSKFLYTSNANSFGSGKGVFSGKSSMSIISAGRVQLREELAGRNDHRMELFRTIASLCEVAVLDDAAVLRFAKLLGSSGVDPVYNQAARQELLNIFDALSKQPHLELGDIPELLQDLNAWETNQVDAMDFERRLGAYEKLEKRRIGKKNGGLTMDQAFIIANQAVFDMNEDEYPVRSAAQNFIQQVLLTNKSTDVAQRIVVGVVVPALKSGMKAKNRQLRKGYLNLLSEVAQYGAGLCAPANGIEEIEVQERFEDLQRALFSDLKQLINQEEPEKDFFTSIVHVQAYRQSSYLAFLRGEMASGGVKLHASTVLHVLVPLTLHILLESSKEKESHMKEQGILAIGELAAHLPWTHYFNLIKHLFNIASTKPDLEKRCLKAVCGVLDRYHFPPAREEPTLERALLKQVLPMLQKYLITKKSPQSIKKVIRVPIAVAIVKVMKQLSEEKLQQSIPRLVTSVVQMLKSFDVDARNDARDALTSIALELGPEHFSKVIEILFDTLVEGYQLHVRGYTLHHLLQGTLDMHVQYLVEERKKRGQYIPDAKGFSLQDPKENNNKGSEEEEEPDQDADSETQQEEQEQKDKEGDDAIIEKLNIKVCGGYIDELLPRIMEVVEAELFGEIGQQKSADSEYHSRIKQLFEAKTNRSYDTLHVLAKMIAFLPVQSIHEILKIFLDKVSSSADLRELRITEEALRKIGLGLAHNPDVRVSHLLVYVHHLVSSEYRHKLEKRQKRRKTIQDEIEGEPSSTSSTSSSADVQEGKLSVWLVSESATEQIRAERRVQERNSYKDIHLVEETPQMTGKDRFELKRKRNSAQVKKATKRANMHIIVEHGLDLLLGALRAKRLDIRCQQHRDMLDPFIELLTMIFKESKASKSTVLALRVLSALIKWELPSLAVHIKTIMGGIMALLQKIGFSSGATGGGSNSALADMSRSTAADATQESIRTVTLFLRGCSFHKVPDDQAKLLVLLAQHNMNVSQRQQTTLSLLKGIVHRKLVSAEIYDVMEKLAEEVFTSTNQNVRMMSTQVLVEFLINYPLSEKRLRQHLNLMLANLDFGVEDGRVSGLTMLRVIISKFPSEVLEEIAQLCFFPLVLRLVNEPSGKVKTLVADVIKKLLSRVNKSTVVSLQGFLLNWIDAGARSREQEQTTDDKDSGQQAREMERVAVQVIGLLVECDAGEKYVGKKDALLFLEKICDILRAHLLPSSASHEEWEERFMELENDFGQGEGWLTPYHCALALHKVSVHCKSLGGCAKVLTSHKPGEESLFTSLVQPMARFHPHIWVRLACLRLIGQVMDAVDPSSVFERDVNKLSMSTVAEVQTLTRLHTSLLGHESLDEKVADQAVKNLVWLASVLIENEAAFQASSSGAAAGDEDGGASDEEKEQASSKRQGDKGYVPKSVTVSWLIHRLSFIARFKGGTKDSREFADIRQCSSFKIFAFIATKWKETTEKLHPFLIPMMSSLVRVSTQQVTVLGYTLHAPALAAEVLDLLENIVGVTPFTKAYSAVQTSMSSVREERKRKRVLEKVVDPAVAQVRREKRNVANKRSKKRKIAFHRQRQGR